MLAGGKLLDDTLYVSGLTMRNEVQQTVLKLASRAGVKVHQTRMKVDDPVGAISVHGTNGLWGVISVGLFADGKSNYGGSWGGVPGAVTGLF